jgi:choline kinase
MIKLGPEAAKLVFDIAENFAKNGQWNFWVPYAIQNLLTAHTFYALSTDNLPWIEIDYLHDLEDARNNVLPAILNSI